jgi:predicted Zn-dependent protease
MMAAGRGNSGGDQAPDFLRTHPVTTTRIGEAKQRAVQIGAATPGFSAGLTVSDNPLLPGGLRLPEGVLERGGKGDFGWARERLRVLSAETPAAAVREYERLRRKAGELDEAQRYGLAVARLRGGGAPAALELLQPLLAAHPGDTWLALTLAEAEARAGRREAADRRFEDLLRRMPHSRAVAVTYAQLLAERNSDAAGRRAQAVLRPLLASASGDPTFQRTFARASEVAGEPVRAGEAWAEVAYLTGRPEQALLQLQTLKRHPQVDYYARARIDARIAQITPVVLELQRQGVHDEVLERG